MKKLLPPHLQSFTHDGFTLIELIVVFALFGILSMAGLSAYSIFSSSQGIQVGAADLANVLTTAKTRAISQAAPPQCSGKSLQGYWVNMNLLTSQFSLSAACSGTIYLLDTHNLPPSVKFVAGSMTSVFFIVSSGSPNTPGTITLNSNGKTKTISVQSTGNIMTN